MNRRSFLTVAALAAAYPAYRGLGSLFNDRLVHFNGGQLRRLKAALTNPNQAMTGITFIGDSITWGTGTRQGPNPDPRNGTLSDPRDNFSSESYVNNVKRFIGNKFVPSASVKLSNWPTSPSGQSVVEFLDGGTNKAVRISNQGINGASTTSYMARNLVASDEDNFALLPDDNFVFVQLGTNDRIVDRRNPKSGSELAANLERLVSQINDKADVILMCANPSTVEASGKYLFNMGVVREAVLAVAKNCRVDFIDNYALFDGLDLKAHVSDGSHPNVKGHSVIAGNIISAIELA
ncbi:SGNH/GDSL hydrolase family protein [Pseudomonas sp. KCA11]|uniref:SGNH/GDSL hydrolase family protein n=1 Tax=unclassified Pseudomonas TaxID=196821 RepID=UPI001A9E1615|nr:SGNH/GDSL hydrolase family protein [Pseudomonas sp. KCA11]MCE5993428.1 SGNH/GDSL hydrolase family protein [Pseudomonas sp. KCA11]